MLFVPSFAMGRLNRAELAVNMPGGKGINIACTLQILGTSVVAMGFIGGHDAHFIEETLRTLGLTTNFVYIEEKTRTNYTIVDKRRGRLTQILEKGPLIKAEEIAEFSGCFNRILSQTNFVVIAGSLPPGVKSSLISELILAAKERGIKTAVNVTEDLLLEVINAKPFLVKPDLREANKFLGERLSSLNGRKRAVTKLREWGIETVLLSFDILNQIVATQTGILEARIKEARIVNRVGVQDAMLAGFIHELEKGSGTSTAIRVGTAAGAATATTTKNWPESRAVVETYLEAVEIKEV
jgi:1-phosphofructokinase/tagatose 6-phosphate kinase